MSCNNCGHKQHCGETCTQTYKDGDNKEVLVLCCNSCHCNDCKKGN